MPAARTAHHVPGETGVWVFIAGDVLIFCLFFVTYLAGRAHDPTGYRLAQKHLDQTAGLLNTCLMISSSWCVAAAVQEVRRRRPRAAIALIGAAMGCGACFAATKCFEYATLAGSGFTLETHEFFGFYYGLTGVHLLHVLVGLGVLAYMRKWARRAALTAAELRNLESGASFWHLVDLLWIMLFALLYLVR